MPINIEMTRPLQVETEELNSKLYLTHAVFTDFQDDPFALIADYTTDPISVFPSRYDKESQMFQPVSEEVGQAIRLHIEAHPIELPTENQIKEALEDGEI